MPKEGSKRNYRKEYDNYHSSPKQKKNRAARNASRASMIRSGKASRGDGKDVHHKDGNPRNTKASNLRVTLMSKNRSFKRTKNARKA
jgi:hypothetical protein